MQNHHHHQQLPSPPPRKPPRPPPLSVTIPATQSRPHQNSLSSDSFNSPTTFHDPHDPTTTTTAIEKYYSPRTSPFPTPSPKDAATPDNFPPPPPPPHHQIINFTPPLSAANFYEGGRKRSGKEGGGIGVVGKVGLLMRVLEMSFCLVSFSVMATDKTKGWSGDSFDRYKEYRFCLTVNIIGFLYSGFQAFVQACHLATGKHAITHRLRYHFDFLLDQVLAYLLISALSASASRVSDWQANWGKDEFTEKASASVGIAFLAFITFAMSSLISGYSFCNPDL